MICLGCVWNLGINISVLVAKLKAAITKELSGHMQQLGVMRQRYVLLIALDRIGGH